MHEETEENVKKLKHIGIPDMGDLANGQYPKFSDLSDLEGVDKLKELEDDFFWGRKKKNEKP